MRSRATELERAILAWRVRSLALGFTCDEVDELEDHLRQGVHEQMAAGNDETAALETAFSRLGTPEQLAVRSGRSHLLPRPPRVPRRDRTDGAQTMRSLASDLRYALRCLRKKPGFTLAVVTILALGIGMNSAVFTLIYDVVWRPPALEDPESLVVFASTDSEGRAADGLSYPDFLDYSKDETVTHGLAVYFPVSVELRTREWRRSTWGAIASDNYWRALGVHAALGRVFSGEEGSAGDPEIVISHSLWQSRFAGDPGVVGRAVQLNGHPFTVTGVAPRGFRGAHALLEAEFWVPVSTVREVLPGGEGLLEDRKRRNLWTVGRLKEGVTLAQAQLRYSDLARQLEEQYPAENEGIGIGVFPESYARVGMGSGPTLRMASFVLLVSVALVLVIACVNVANLILARSSARGREIAIRSAMGASRARVVRQLLTENGVLALLGGVAGLGLSTVAMRVLAAAIPPGSLPVHFDPGLDARVIGYALLLTLATALLFGLAPGLQTARGGGSGMRGDGRSIASPRAGRLQRTLVIGEVATCLVLLVTAALFARSLRNAVHADVGFEPRDRWATTVDLNRYGYDDSRRFEYYERLRERVTRLPDVVSASWAMPIPLDTFAANASVYVPGFEGADGRQEPFQILYSNVDGNYFDTLGTPLVAGRAIEPEDRAGRTRVAVVNSTMAERFWPEADPIGQTFRLDDPSGPAIEVVGVAVEGKYRQVSETPLPYVFFPMEQGTQLGLGATLVVRTRPGAATIGDQVRAESRALDPEVELSPVTPLEHRLASSAFLPARLAATLISLFGLLGLALALLGLHGLLSYLVSQRVAEIGLRMAMGADRLDILRLVVGSGLRTVAIGIGVGLLFSIAAGQLVSGLLYGVSAIDPWSFAAVPPALLLVTLLASLAPALRASRVDPLAALRQD